jgi:predicted nuclease of predicted toxin-antitoxin system
MRLLLDENLDWRLRARFGCTSRGLSAPDRLGRNRKRGIIKKAVEAGFDVLITMDGNMVHQQNLAKYPIAVVALRAASNRLGDTHPLMAALLALLPHIKSGTVTFLPS